MGKAGAQAQRCPAAADGDAAMRRNSPLRGFGLAATLKRKTARGCKRSFGAAVWFFGIMQNAIAVW